MQRQDQCASVAEAPPGVGEGPLWEAAAVLVGGLQ